CYKTSRYLHSVKSDAALQKKPSHLHEPTNTFSKEKTSDNRNLTNTSASEPAEPQTVTQDTVDAVLNIPLHSKRKVIIRRSPVPFPRTQRVAEDGQGSGFFARSGSTILSVAVGHTIVFDSVITNTHNDYSGYTGAFTCSTPGLYALTWTIQINRHFLKSQLLKNGAPVADGFAGDDERYWTTGTSTAILSLAQGDVLVVHVTGLASADPTYVLPHVTSFSGFLV
ncbi:collagen alpha-1(X) chain-like, partial [Mizuhopecten yessoensis]|uniref:collagen alpha-1(X) chain-like n=1 Tax=Mizuhopecten yessoensis TaxID=6573 RepID=UPI000B45CD2A